MQLKLAEYKNGKFERFLDLGKDFGYFGDSILLMRIFGAPSTIQGFFNLMDWFKGDERFDLVCKGIEQSTIKKDEKDPLNRFDGLFDGRTYGEGRFVLVEDKDNVKNICNLPVLPFYSPPLHEQEYELKEVIFNIHENPELWEKVK